VILTLAIRIVAPERVWFGGRVISESVKTITWRYMMHAEPFNDEKADARFLAELQVILEAKRSLAWNLGGAIAETPQITEKMRDLRAATLHNRKEAYRGQRIADQRSWYATKADVNRRTHQRVFWLTIGVQLCAVAWAILMVARRTLSLNMTGTFTAFAAALIAWGQVKRYQELAQSYALAALELGIVQEKLTLIETEEDFSLFVADAENAISREHTMWAARRDVL